MRNCPTSRKVAVVTSGVVMGNFCYLFNISARTNGGPVRRADNLSNLSTV